MAQAGALLHNLGKVTSQFLNKMASSDLDQNFRYQHILHLIIEDYPDLRTNFRELYDDLQKEDENEILLDAETITALKRYFTLLYPFDDRSYRPGDMIEYLGQRNELYKQLWIKEIFKNGSLLTHLMNRAHHGASGGEKQDICVKSQVGPDKLYKSTPFGWESSAPNLKNTDKHKHEIEKIIQKHICSNSKSLSFDSFSNQLCHHLETVVADSQRPLNDVTVWDIGHSGMAFLLTQAIAQMTQQGTDIDHFELNKIRNKNTLFWRVLSIRLNGLDYLESASSLADLRVRYSLIQKTLENIRHTLESIPIAIEVYRDENGSFYIFPNLPNEDQLTKEVLSLLEPKLTVDGIKLECLPSEKLVNHPDDQNGQYIGNYISKQIESKVPKVHNLMDYTSPWKSAVNKEICVACGIRPQGYGAEQITDYNTNPFFYARKAQRRNICCLCMHRRTGISERWATKELHDSTVWIDEVADMNGRVALVVGQFDLQKWEMSYPKGRKNILDPPKTYLKIKNLGAPLKNGEKININQHQLEWDNEIKMLVGEKEIKNIQKFKRKDLPELIIDVDDIQCEEAGYRILLCKSHEISIDDEITIIGNTFRALDDRTLVTVGDNASEKVKNVFLWDKRFIITDKFDIYKMTESQSFARIRRVWETTKNFWQDILPTDEKLSISESECGKILGFAGPRLKIEGKKENTLGRYHTYELTLHNTKLSVVWIPEDDGKNGYFITAKNSILIMRLLGKLLPDQDKSESAIEYQTRLQNWAVKTLKKEISGILIIEEPTGYGAKNKELGSIEIENVDIITDSTYTPAIPILAEPRTFMSLVPADNALDVVNKIKDKYEQEMGKVRNRLPLHLSVVYASHKTPLRVILDSGHRMLKQKSITADGWTVTKKINSPSLPDSLKTDRHFNECVCLELKKDKHRVVWYVPLRMGDGNETDKWYSYVFVKCDKDGKPPLDRKQIFEAPCPWNLDPQPTWLLHANDLEEGDIIYYTPSTLDFQWLDTSGRRFEIAYENNGNRLDIPQRPYMLDDLEIIQGEIWETLRCYLTTTQIHALYELIETKRFEWELSDSEVFRNFCSDVITNLEWKKPKIHGSKESVYPWKTDTKPPERDWLKKWADYAVRGWLSDVIELNLKVLKRKPDSEREEIV